jgi:hypothetical protein
MAKKKELARFECNNCYCLITHSPVECRNGLFCSELCYNAKKKEYSRLSLTSNINEFMESKKESESELAKAEHKSKCFDELMASTTMLSKLHEFCHESSAELKKDIEKCKLELKIMKLSIIICISIRDKKGTYPQLKPKYSETLVEYMALMDTSGELCEVADGMKRSYESFELLYDILK